MNRRPALVSLPLVALVACTPDPVANPFESASSADEIGDGDGESESAELETGEEDSDTGSSSCGNSVVEPGEECDLGPQNADDDKCTSQCTIAACGDGFVYEGFEECDDGNNVQTDECLSDCKLATCGDGLVHEGVEACDDGNIDETDLCNSMCMPTSCGDGVVQAGEQCDDGNADTTDECPACQFAFCGDGYAQAGTEECDDGNDDNTDGCIAPFCKLATCGDGHVQAGTEECDDGNLEDSDDCPTSCAPAFCGDGFVLAGMESCDDGNNLSGDGCTAECVSEAKLAFVSSQMYTGNLGGLAGADAKCQELAEAANLAGTFMAWLSAADGSPATRFTQATTPYMTVTGVKIADNWTDLIDGSLDATLDVTETGGPAPIGNTSCAGGGFPTVWTATNANGLLSGSTCSNWTSTAGGSAWGLATQTSASWTSWCSGGSCAWNSPIYCFQQ